MKKKIDEDIVVRAAREVLKHLPTFETMKSHAPKLFVAASAVKNALAAYDEAHNRYLDVEREAGIAFDARIGDLDQKLKQAQLEDARGRAEAEDAFNATVNGAKALHGTKLQAMKAAVDAFDATRRKLLKLGGTTTDYEPISTEGA